MSFAGGASPAAEAGRDEEWEEQALESFSAAADENVSWRGAAAKGPPKPSFCYPANLQHACSLWMAGGIHAG
jgi:hypothetical protein